MFSLSHAPVPSMHLPVVLSTLPPPLNLSTCNLCLLRPRHLLSTGAFPPVCLSLAGWLSCCQLLHASASRHLLSHSRLTRPSLTPILRSRQLVVALPLRTTFASWGAAAWQLAVSLPLLMRRRCCRQCAGVFAVILIAIVALVARCRAGVVAALIVGVIVVDKVHHHCCQCCIPLRCCHHCWLHHLSHHCQHRRLRPLPRRCVVVAFTCRIVTIVINVIVCRVVDIVVVVGGENERCASVQWHWCGCV